MRKERLKRWIYIICGLLTLTAFFAKDFLLYDFHMEVSDYSYVQSQGEKPQQASTSVWFSYGDGGRQLQYGMPEGEAADVRLYGLTDEESVPVMEQDMNPISSEFRGNFIAAAPVRTEDVDDDGAQEIVHDFARADFGKDAFNPVPQRFNHPEIALELVFAERKYILVYFNGQPLADGEVSILSEDGEERVYGTNDIGRIEGLPNRDIRNGFTASYSPDGTEIYRMYYALEDYPHFTQHFFRAHIPLFIALLLSIAGIAVIQFLRVRAQRRKLSYQIDARERMGIHCGSHLSDRTTSKYLMIRWMLLMAGMFVWTYAGKLLNQGQALNEVVIPVFSCPFNMDQIVETPCYYLSHLPSLFGRFGPEFPQRNLIYGAVFLITLFLGLIFLGRILCGFVCPAGLIQDLMYKLRQVLHIPEVIVSDRMNKILQPLKWLWIVLFLGFAFTGGDFCDICPLKVFTTAQGGFWTNLYLGGFLAVAVLVGSFFIKRFWCLMCPMGYLMGIFRRFNLFKLKKDCTACTECGACYETCAMRLKNVYTEREKEDVQTVDCLMCGECIHKCPEDKALSMTFCGRTVYQSSREVFMSRYRKKNQKQGQKKED